MILQGQHNFLRLVNIGLMRNQNTFFLIRLHLCRNHFLIEVELLLWQGIQALIRIWLHAYDSPKCTVGEGSRIQRLLLFLFLFPSALSMWKIFINLSSVSLKLHSWYAFLVSPKESCLTWTYASTKWCGILFLKSNGWQDDSGSEKLNLFIFGLCYEITTTLVNNWNTCNCCK